MGKQLNKSEQKSPNLDELISLEAAAALSGLSHDHLRRLAGKGTIWAAKVGRNWLTTEAAVREYLARDRRRGPKTDKKNN